MNQRFTIQTGVIGAFGGALFAKQDLIGDTPIKQSLLGTDVWSNMVIPAGSYQALDGTVIEFDQFELDAVLFSVMQRKNIVKTPVAGRTGTVKEYISDGDYQVSIQGVMVGENSETYPEEQMLQLTEILKAPVAINIESEFLAFFDIDMVAVESFRFSQKRGSRSIQAFNVSAVSDTPLELKELGGL